jgi:SAM-dependent methyltransferase
LLEAEYVLGSGPRELQRLTRQEQIIGPITERLLRHAGLKEGMRVLDLGCGAGGVSLIAADIVGQRGSVVGIDRSEEAIKTAKSRIQEMGLRQVDFRLGSADAFSFDQTFDMAIGRYILIHQPQPTVFIRAIKRHVRPGGVIAFHEISLHRSYYARPSYEDWELVAKCLDVGFSLGAPSWDAAGRLVEHFQNADLPCPQLFSEMPVGGGPDSPIYGWLAETVRSLLPTLIRKGGMNEEAIRIDTLEARLRQGAVDRKSQVDVAPNVCAWAKT